jgi:hypothetical protein
MTNRQYDLWVRSISECRDGELPAEALRRIASSDAEMCDVVRAVGAPDLDQPGLMAWFDLHG